RNCQGQSTICWIFSLDQTANDSARNASDPSNRRPARQSPRGISVAIGTFVARSLFAIVTVIQLRPPMGPSEARRARGVAVEYRHRSTIRSKSESDAKFRHRGPQTDGGEPRHALLHARRRMD